MFCRNEKCSKSIFSYKVLFFIKSFLIILFRWYNYDVCDPGNGGGDTNIYNNGIGDDNNNSILSDNIDDDYDSNF